MAAEATQHEAGCIRGGFSCQYWMIVDGCSEEHHEAHIVGADSRCPCGTLYPSAESGWVGFDASLPDGAPQPRPEWIEAP